MLGHHEGGNERYIKNVALGLINEKQKKDIVKLAVCPKYFTSQKDFDKKNLIKIPFNNDFYRLAYFLRSQKFDIVHTTYVIPFFSDDKSVVTVHDASFKRYPHFYSPKDRFIFEFLLPWSLKKAKAIVVPSVFTKKELVHFFPEYKNKVSVVYESVDRSFYSIDKARARSKIKKKFSINEPFILTINSKNPKKNINILLKAANLRVVVVGSGFLNYVTDEDLNLLYNACELFVAPSIYEGFNLPLLEALNTKAVVLASAIDVNRELYQDAVVYFNPKDAKSLSLTLKKTLKNIEAVRNKTQRSFSKIKSKFDKTKKE